nr:G protein-coupled receptor [Proales similis]
MNSSDSSDRLNSDMTKLNGQILFYSSMAMYPVGVVQNLFSIYLFSKPNPNRTNMGFLYRWQCSIDTLVLVLFFFVFAHPILLPFSIFSLSDLSCRLFSLLRRTLLHASSWMTVLITTDRYMAICHPSRLTALRKSRLRLSLVILAMFALIVLINVENVFFYLKQDEPVPGNQTAPSGICTSSSANLTASDIVSVLVRTYIPFALMIWLEVAIVRRLVGSKTTLSRGSGLRERHYTSVVLTLNCAFFLFNFPFSILFLLNGIFRLANVLQLDLSAKMFNLIMSSSAQFSLFPQSFSFVLNLLLNRIYRQQFKAVLGWA